MTDKLQKFMQLTKVDVAKKRIYGTFTAEVVDKSGEVADYETTKAAMQAWSAEIEKISGGKSLGNIRKMHGKEVCGKAVEIVYDDVAKAIHGCIEANEQTIEEADKGFLNGFSIGGSYAKKWADPVHKGKTRFTPVIAEVSVVDNPCVDIAVFNAVKDATFAVIKADGTEEMRKFEPKKPQIKAVWKAGDGSEHETEEAALAKQAELDAVQPVVDALDKVEKPSQEAEQLKKAADDLAKAVDALSKATAKADMLEKAISTDIPKMIEEKMAAFAKRLKALEDQPAPDNALLTTVHKGGEVEKDEQPQIPLSMNRRSPGEVMSLINR